MKTCYKCGHKMNDNDKFCPECGAKNLETIGNALDSESISTKEQPSTMSQIENLPNDNETKTDDDNHDANPSSKKPKRGLIVALIALLCIIVFFIISESSTTITSLSVSYEGETEAGTVLDSNNKGFIVKEVYSNGREKEVDGWRVKTPYRLAPDTVSTVHIIYEDWDVTCDVVCTTVVEKLEAVYKGSTKPGTEITKSDIIVTGTYTDGSTAIIKSYSLDDSHVLKAGEVEKIVITYHDKECVLDVPCDSVRKPEIEGNTINCTAEEFVEYLRSQTNQRFIITETSSNEGDDGLLSTTYEFYLDNDREGDLLIMERDAQIALFMISMVEGKEDVDMYAYALYFASLIDESFEADDELKTQLIVYGDAEHNGLHVWNSSGITNGRYSCIISPTDNKDDIAAVNGTEQDSDENAPSGINFNEADWNSWKSSHAVSIHRFMEASQELDFTWTIPENGDSSDKICYFVDENNKEVDGIYMMYGAKDNSMPYVALYTKDSAIIESDEYQKCCRKIMQAYTADHENDEVNIVISDERADEIIGYIIDHRVEHCLVDEMKIRGLFSDEESLYGITIGY